MTRWPAVRREVVWALDAGVVAFMVAVVELKVLFALVCPMLNFLTCHMTTLSHLRASPGTGQGRMMVTAPSIV